MSDKLKSYFQCVLVAERWEFQVGVVTWNGPHTPTIRWIAFRSWKRKPTAAQLSRAELAARAQTRFFRTCELCHEFMNAGHMHGDQICQGCAQRHLGIVY